MMSYLALGILILISSLAYRSLLSVDSRFRKWQEYIWLTAAATTVVISAKTLRSGIPIESVPMALKAGVLIALVGFTGFAIRIRGASWLVERSIWGLLILSPLIPILWGQVMFGRQALNARFMGAPPARLSPEHSPSSGKDVWVLVFDELDYKICFEQQALEKLPALRRFAGESFNASQCFPPAGWTTISIPSMLVGRVLTTQTALRDANTLRLGELDGSHRVWGGTPSLFTDLGAAGRSYVAAGAFLPYSRLVSGASGPCLSASNAYERYWHTQSEGLLGALRAHVLEIMLRSGSTLHQTLSPKGAIAAEYAQMTRDLDAQVTHWTEKPAYDFHWVHYAAPHYPALPEFGNSYLSNLQAADRSLAAFRQSMEKADRWENATVIVLADHWCREGENMAQGPEWVAGLDRRWSSQDHRVPFLVKFPGNHPVVTYQHPFNLVLMRQLIPSIINREIDTPAALTAWLDRNRVIGESPTTVKLP
jgi:hypothetical protein